MTPTIFSRSFFLELIDALPCHVQIFTGGKNLYQNARSSETRKISGLDGYLAAVHPDDREFSYKNWNTLLKDKSFVEQEIRYLGKDNVYRWYKEVIILMDHMRVGILVDIHDTKTREELGMKLTSELCQNLHAGLNSLRNTTELLPNENPAMKVLKKDIQRIEELLSDAQRRALNLSFKKFTPAN